MTRRKGGRETRLSCSEIFLLNYFDDGRHKLKLKIWTKKKNKVFSGSAILTPQGHHDLYLNTPFYPTRHILEFIVNHIFNAFGPFTFPLRLILLEMNSEVSGLLVSGKKRNMISIFS